jgi:Flp pilus assembly protein TadD
MATAFEIYFSSGLAVVYSLFTLQNMSNAKPHDPRTKTSIIQGHMAEGDWRNAIRVAARLPRLDKHRNAILDAQGAYENPRFYMQIGRDPGALIAAGHAALIERFGE